MLLDKRTAKLLSIINKECGEGAFKVLEIGDMISDMPKKYKTDKDNIKQMTDFLCERGFVQVKYSDDNVYCITPLPKGRLYHEQAEEEKKEKKRERRLVTYTIMGAFLAAFAGAVAGMLLILMR